MDAQSDDPFEVQTGRYSRYFEPDSREDLEFRFTRKLVLTARRWTAVSEDWIKRDSGETRSRWQTLLALAFSGEATTTSALSHRLGMKWPPLIRTLNALEADGLIRRRENPDDGRSRLIEITPQGEEVVAMIKPLLADVRSRVLESLSNEQLRESTRLLDYVLSGSLAVANGKTDD